MVRALQTGSLVAGLSAGLLSVVVSRHDPAYSLAGTSLGRTALELAAGWGLLAVALVAWRRRPDSACGPLLAAASVAWFVQEWNNPGAPAAAFTVGLVLSGAAPPLVAHAALAYRGPRVMPVERLALAAAYAATVLVLGLAPALVFDPARESCADCPPNLLLAHGDPALFASLNRWGVRIGAVWAAGLAVLVVARLGRGTSALRRAGAPVLLAAAAYLALVARDYGHSLSRGTLSTDPTDRVLWAGQAGALVTLAIGVAWGWLRARRRRAAVARVVVELASAPPPGGLRDALAASLGDPSLLLGFPVEDGSVVDAGGRPIRLGERVTAIRRGGRTLALVSHAPDLLAPGELEEVVSAAALALDHERLRAEVRAQLERLRESRTRIVESADAARRRLERDLHDGAQQRLVALALSLGVRRAQTGDPAVAERLDEAAAELRHAIAELRELAHGIFPALLAEEGFAAAVESLAEEAPVPVALGPLPPERFEPAVETAAYFVVADAVRAADGALTVSAERRHGTLVVELAGIRAHEAPLAVNDRVGALDGRLVVENGTLRAEIPCA